MDEKTYLVKCWSSYDLDKILPAETAFAYARELREQGHTVSVELWKLREEVLEPGLDGPG